MRLKYACIGLCIGIVALVFIEVTDLGKPKPEQGAVTTSGITVVEYDSGTKAPGQPIKLKDPLEVAKFWAKGVKERNALLQYSVMNEELRKRYHDIFEGLNWVTGTSSPWIIEYNVSPVQEEEGRHVYTVEFISTDSTKALYRDANHITVNKADGYWLLSEIRE